MKRPYEIMHDALSAKNNVRVKLLGDSITHGVGGTGFAQNGDAFIEGFARNPDGYCWANTFKRYMEDRFACSVINNACSGTNIEHIIDNFDILVDKEDDVVLCVIGTNDRNFPFVRGDKPTREQQGARFYRDVLRLYGMFRERGVAVVFVANIPASAANEARDGETYWRILHMEDINAIYKKAVETGGFPFVSLYDAFAEHCARHTLTVDELLDDGLHPNDRGHDVICELMLRQLRLS